MCRICTRFILVSSTFPPLPFLLFLPRFYSRCVYVCECVFLPFALVSFLAVKFPRSTLYFRLPSSPSFLSECLLFIYFGYVYLAATTELLGNHLMFDHRSINQSISQGQQDTESTWKNNKSNRSLPVLRRVWPCIGCALTRKSLAATISTMLPPPSTPSTDFGADLVG